MSPRLTGTGLRRLVTGLALAALGAGSLSACTSSDGGRGNGKGPITPPPTPTLGSGQGLSPLGSHWDVSRNDVFTPYLSTIPGSQTFDELVWCDIQKAPNVYKWNSVDKLLDAADARNIRVLIKIRTGVCALTVSGSAAHVRGRDNKTESAMPKSMASYTAFVKAVVAHVKPHGVTEYAVENEINSPSYWAGSPADYSTLVTAAGGAIRAADPAAKVVDAGLSSTSYGYGIADQLLKAGQGTQAVAAYSAYFARRIGTRGEQIPAVRTPTALKTVLQSAQGVRNLAYLALMKQLATSGAVDVRQIHYYEPAAAIPSLLTYLHDQTPSRTPIEAWEVGSFWKDANGDDADRAAEVVRSVSMLLAGGVTNALWLPLATAADNRRGQEIRYGLLDPDGNVRAAGITMAVLVAASRSATVAAVTVPGLAGVSFDVGGQTTLVVWSTNGDRTMAAPSGSTSAAVGQELAPTGAGGVTVGSTPVIVHATGTADQLLATLGG
jgi:hypothetical protein